MDRRAGEIVCNTSIEYSYNPASRLEAPQGRHQGSDLVGSEGEDKSDAHLKHIQPLALHVG